MRPLRVVMLVVAATFLLAQSGSAQLAPLKPPPKPTIVKPPPLPPVAPFKPMTIPSTATAPAKNAPPPPPPKQAAQKSRPVLTAPEPSISELRAETMSSIGQILAPYANGKAASSNPSVKRALQVLAAQQLTGPPPHVPPSSGLAAALAKAMNVDDKTAQLLPQLAALNDSFAAGTAATRQSALALLQAAGKPKPGDAALSAMLADAQAAHDAASGASQHGKIAAGKDMIDVDSSPDGGMSQISVFSSGADGKPERVTFDGTEETVVVNGDLQTQIRPQPAQIVTAAQASDMRGSVNGTWTDRDGHVWEISGEGDNIVFTETLDGGHQIVYPGHWMLGLPYASHLVNDVLDMDDTLPGDVKSDLADSYHPPFAVRLQYDPGSDIFSGLWISGQVTYGATYHNIKVVQDPTWDKRLVLTRSLKPAYHIVSVKIDYSPWEAAMREKSAEEGTTQLELNDREQQLKEAESLYDAKLAAAKAEQNKLLAARAASQSADDAAANATLNPSDETPQYKQQEADLARTTQKLADITGVIDRTSAMGGTIPNATLDRQEALQKQADAQTAALNKLADKLGLNAKRDALLKAAEDADDARRHEEVNYIAAVAAAEAAHKGRDEAIDLYDIATRAHDDADAAVHALAAKGVPLITYVAATDGNARTYYYAQWWDPKEALDFYDKEIPALQNVLVNAFDDRLATRGFFLAAQQDALNDTGRLYQGIIESALAQGAVEAGYYAKDVYDKWTEAGPLGALAEAVKKLVEGIILGPPSFYEPQLAQTLKLTQPTGAVSDLWKLAKDTGAKRAIKTETGSAVSYRVKKYFADHSFEEFLAATDKAVIRKAGRPAVILDAQGIVNARALYAQFQKAYAAQQKAWADASFAIFPRAATATLKDKAKALLTSKPVEKMAVGLAKDLSKQLLKQQIAEILEGAPLYDSIFSEYKAQAAGAVFMAASAAYWKAEDEYKMRLAERAEVLRDYDPNTQLKTTTNREFPSGQMVRIEFTDHDGNIMATGKRTFKVLLGGREAHFAGGPYLQFDVLAKDLKDDGHGGVDLSIIVSE